MAKTKEKRSSLKSGPLKDWVPGEYKAMAIIPKPGTGLFVLRTLTILANEVIAFEDNAEDLREIQTAKLEREISS